MAKCCSPTQVACYDDHAAQQRVSLWPAWSVDKAASLRVLPHACPGPLAKSIYTHPACCCAGRHGFSGHETSNTMVLTPGQHAIRVDYSQVLAKFQASTPAHAFMHLLSRSLPQAPASAHHVAAAVASTTGTNRFGAVSGLGTWLRCSCGQQPQEAIQRHSGFSARATAVVHKSDFSLCHEWPSHVA